MSSPGSLLASRRSGRVQLAGLLFAGSLLLLVGLVFWLAQQGDPSQPPVPAGSATAEGPESLVIFCAAACKQPIEAAVQSYQQQYQVPVKLQFGSSGSLLASLELSPVGDLFVSTDDSFMAIAREKNLVAETIPLATSRAVLAVKKGNPLGIHTLQDLLAGTSRFGQGDKSTAIGKLTESTLAGQQLWQPLVARTSVFKDTVNHLANDLLIGALDAAVVWDSTVAQYPDLEEVELPELKSAVNQVELGVMRKSQQPTAALRLARYLSASDQGLKHFAQAGFQAVAGDPWEDRIDLKLFAGSMLRPAVEETIRAFEQREGVRITRVYDGCGILVAEMNTGVRPDAFFACDKKFMEMVDGYFQDKVDVSTNQLVILVKKGNPFGITGLADLGKPNLRIGVGHEQKCALGALTQVTLKETGFQSDVMKNVKVQLSTGDGLVNHLLTDSLDAVIAYVSNGVVAADKLDAIAIDVECSIATQPFGVGTQSKHKQLTSRLLTALRSAESQKRFESAGFHWTNRPSLLAPSPSANAGSTTP